MPRDPRGTPRPPPTQHVDLALVHGDAEGAAAVSHGGHEGPRVALHVVALGAVELIRPIVTPHGVDAVVEGADPWGEAGGGRKDWGGGRVGWGRMVVGRWGHKDWDRNDWD